MMQRVFITSKLVYSLHHRVEFDELNKKETSQCTAEWQSSLTNIIKKETLLFLFLIRERSEEYLRVSEQ